MPAHNFLFHPDSDELPHYIAAVEKIEQQDKFRGQIAVDLQLHQGTWTGEFSALTARKMMEFITEVTMELPPEKEQGDQWETAADGPDYQEGAQPDPEDGTDGPGSIEGTSYEPDEPFAADEPFQEEDGSDDGDSGTAVYNDAADERAYEEHEAAAGRAPAPKKLKRPASVSKTSNSAVTVEED